MDQEITRYATKEDFKKNVILTSNEGKQFQLIGEVARVTGVWLAHRQSDGMQISIHEYHSSSYTVKVKLTAIPGRQYVHTNGMVYTVIMLTNTESLRKEHPIDVVYIGHNGHIWSRHLTDWDRSFKECVGTINVNK